MAVFNIEDADGPVAAMPSWNRQHISFFPERSRPLLSPSFSTPKSSMPPGTGDYAMNAAGIAGGTGLYSVTPGVDFVEVPQKPQGNTWD